MQYLNKGLLPSMINHCLQLAFTFTLQFMRFTFTELFVNIAKHCGKCFLDCTWDSLGKLQLFFKSSHSVKAILEFCASRLDNSKFYDSLHLPLPDLPSWSLRLGLHRASKDFFVSTAFLQSKQDDSEGSSVAIEKDANANICIAINGLRKNVAFLTVSQTINYVLITSFCTPKETNFACQ